MHCPVGADVASLEKYRPLFARVQALAEGCDDTEMAIGIDLMNFSLRVYAQLKLSAARMRQIGAMVEQFAAIVETAAPCFSTSGTFIGSDFLIESVA